MHHPVLQRYLAKSLAANPRTKTVELPLGVTRRLIAQLRRAYAGKAAAQIVVVDAPKVAKVAKVARQETTVAAAIKVAAPKPVKAKKALAAPGVVSKKEEAKKVKKAAKATKVAAKPVMSVKAKDAGKPVRTAKVSAVMAKPVVAKKPVKRGMNSQRKLNTIPGYASLSDRGRQELLRHFLLNVRDMRVALLNKRGLQQYRGIGPVLEQEIKVWFQGAEVAARG